MRLWGSWDLKAFNVCNAALRLASGIDVFGQVEYDYMNCRRAFCLGNLAIYFANN